MFFFFDESVFFSFGEGVFFSFDEGVFGGTRAFFFLTWPFFFLECVFFLGDKGVCFLT